MTTPHRNKFTLQHGSAHCCFTFIYHSMVHTGKHTSLWAILMASMYVPVLVE